MDDYEFLKKTVQSRNKKVIINQLLIRKIGRILFNFSLFICLLHIFFFFIFGLFFFTNIESFYKDCSEKLKLIINHFFYQNNELMLATCNQALYFDTITTYIIKWAMPIAFVFALIYYFYFKNKDRKEFRDKDYLDYIETFIKNPELSKFGYIFVASLIRMVRIINLLFALFLFILIIFFWMNITDVDYSSSWVIRTEQFENCWNQHWFFLLLCLFGFKFGLLDGIREIKYIRNDIPVENRKRILGEKLERYRITITPSSYIKFSKISKVKKRINLLISYFTGFIVSLIYYILIILCITDIYKLPYFI